MARFNEDALLVLINSKKCNGEKTRVTVSRKMAVSKTDAGEVHLSIVRVWGRSEVRECVKARFGLPDL